MNFEGQRKEESSDTQMDFLAQKLVFFEKNLQAIEVAMSDPTVNMFSSSGTALENLQRAIRETKEALAELRKANPKLNN